LGVSSSPSLTVFRDLYGYLPNLFRIQSAVAGALEAEAAMAHALLAKQHGLTRAQKELVLLAVAAARGNRYCATMHWQGLLALGVKEARLEQVIAGPRQAGLALSEEVREESGEEAVVVGAWGNLECTLADGLSAEPDFDPIELPTRGQDSAGFQAAVPRELRRLPVAQTGGDDEALRPVRDRLGWVPNVFRAQALGPEILAAEANAIKALLLEGGALSTLHKAAILLAVSSALGNVSCTDFSYQCLRTLGLTSDDAYQMAAGQSGSNLAGAEKGLLDFAVGLVSERSGSRAESRERLRRQPGFIEAEMIEAVAAAALAGFLVTVQLGLDTPPDFAPGSEREALAVKTVHLFSPERRQSQRIAAADPDADLVARVKGGDLEAFEELMNRHSRRVYRTLMGILGNPDEARDAVQDTFLKAFEHIGEFQGRSKYSTWLVSIAGNTGVQVLRNRRRLESLDDDGVESQDGFRPKDLRSWAEDPEQLYSKAETRMLIEGAILKLPAKYRIVVVLRDLEQLSIEDSAAALGLGIPALKARHLRGRLMVREALTPSFSAAARGGAA
jgi:RNA polymerase sigma-70 factor, ECF subfamily